MLYSTSGQLYIFFIFFVFGFAGFFLFYFKKLALKLIGQKIKKVCANIIDCIIVFVLAVLFVIINNSLNYGEFRVFVLIAFTFGLIFSYYFNRFLKNKIETKNKN